MQARFVEIQQNFARKHISDTFITKLYILYMLPSISLKLLFKRDGKRMVDRPRVECKEFVQRDDRGMLYIRNWTTMEKYRDKWKMMFEEVTLRIRTDQP